MALDGMHEFCVFCRMFRNARESCEYRRSNSLRVGKNDNFLEKRENFEGFGKKDWNLKKISGFCTDTTDKNRRFRRWSLEILKQKIEYLNFSCNFLNGFNAKNSFNSLMVNNTPFDIPFNENKSEYLSLSESQFKNISKFKMRKERCRFIDETIYEEVITGRIERYNLKGRFGKLVFGNQQMWVYEDDLVVSGVNLRKFKKIVREKSKIQVTFCVKKGIEGGENKVRPVKIQLKSECIDKNQLNKNKK